MLLSGKRLWAANAYDQLFTLKIVGEDPGRCKVLEDILSSVHQRRGEVWRIASARSNSRPLNAPQELLQSSQVRGQKTVFSYFLHFKSSAPQELLQSSQVRGHVRSAGDRTNQASQKQRCYYQRESLLKVCCKIPTPLRGNILSVSSLEGNTLSVKKNMKRIHFHTKVHLVKRWMNQENLNETVVRPSKRVLPGCKNIKCECMFRRRINECFALYRG